MQTILGSGGAIGTVLAKELTKYTDRVRLVSRNPKKINESDELFAADLTNPEQFDKAVEGSEVVYVTIAFDYKARVWEKTWPPFMESVVSACIKHGSKLVFFDNMYIYDPNEIQHMTEETRTNPSSRKGKVRLRLFNMIMDEVKKGNLKAQIHRGADFYGPGINNSVLMEMVMNNLKKGKAAYWLGSSDKKHSFTYTPDAAKATAILGNTEDAYNQVWHMPTHPDPPTGKQMVQLFADALGARPKISAVNKFMLGLIGLFTPVMREFIEMYYQWDRDYVFDSSKFDKQFDFKPKSYEEAVKDIVQSAN